VVNNAKYLTKEQTIQVLKSIRAAIASGELLIKDDSDEIGNKHTHCSWGACNDLRKHYHSPEMHTFPQEFVDTGRSNPLALIKGSHCPMQLPKTSREDYQWGCFYECRVFQTHHRTPTRDEAVELYDAMIATLEGGE
jgi:hypothetical protein